MGNAVGLNIRSLLHVAVGLDPQVRELGAGSISVVGDQHGVGSHFPGRLQRQLHAHRISPAGNADHQRFIGVQDKFFRVLPELVCVQRPGVDLRDMGDQGFRVGRCGKGRSMAHNVDVPDPAKVRLPLKRGDALRDQLVVALPALRLRQGENVLPQPLV